MKHATVQLHSGSAILLAAAEAVSSRQYCTVAALIAVLLQSWWSCPSFNGHIAQSQRAVHSSEPVDGKRIK
jgi:hypothetical protein